MTNNIIEKILRSGIGLADLQERIEFLRNLLNSESRTKIRSSSKLDYALSLANCAKSVLRCVGYDRLSKIEDFLRRMSKDNISPIFPGVVNFGPMFLPLKIEASLKKGEPIPYDTVDCAVKTLLTYETLANWAGKVRGYETVRGLAEILGGHTD